jgi:hypothetical protein
MKRMLLLIATLTLAACTRPGDFPVSSNCVWTEQDAHSFDLNSSSDRRHLRFDAVTAEDISIRWTDRFIGHRREYDERQNQCLETLFAGVAKQHGVDVLTVRQYSLERETVLDAAVMLSFGALYAVVAYILAGRIRRRFPLGEPGFWVMALAMAIGVSLVGYMVGNLWTIVIEGVRLNSGHLSYRMNRIPWRQHWALLILCGFVVFALASLLRSTAGRRRTLG